MPQGAQKERLVPALTHSPNAGEGTFPVQTPKGFTSTSSPGASPVEFLHVTEGTGWGDSGASIHAGNSPVRNLGCGELVLTSNFSWEVCRVITSCSARRTGTGHGTALPLTKTSASPADHGNASENHLNMVATTTTSISV